MNLRANLPVLLYFYQNELTQAEVDTVVDAFDGKSVHLRKVLDINDTRDMIEKCAYVAGSVPLIYFVRKAEGVLTGGVLEDPLERPNASKATSDGKAATTVQASAITLETGHIQPTDANIAAKLMKDEVAQATAKVAPVDVKVEDIVVDKQAAVPAATTPTAPAPVAPTPSPEPAAPVPATPTPVAAKPVAAVAPKPVAPVVPK